MIKTEKTPVDNHVFNVLMRDLVGHDKKASAFLTYLYIYSQARMDSSIPISLRQLAAGTGLSKRAVQSAVKHLAQRQLLSVKRPAPTSIPEYVLHRPWNG